jgi:hypothetical protein
VKEGGVSGGDYDNYKKKRKNGYKKRVSKRAWGQRKVRRREGSHEDVVGGGGGDVKWRFKSTHEVESARAYSRLGPAQGTK